MKSNTKKRAAARRKGMPTSSQLFQHWNNNIIDGFEDGFPDKQCFSCGYFGALERSHILPIQYGGRNEANNIHMLCKCCHLESETLCGNAYWQWLKHMYTNYYDLGFSKYRAKVEVIVEYMKQNRITCPKEGCARFHEQR